LTRLSRSFKAERADERIEIIDDALIEAIYENSNGLVEIAVNQGRADRELGLTIGIPIESVP